MASDWAVVTMPAGVSTDNHGDVHVDLMTKNCTDCDPSAWPFANAVKAGVSSVMCSYNRINGSYGCQNSKLLNGVLKEELGFQGYGRHTFCDHTRSAD
jgi:beta-glucosidase-like glycosyl hydrolase